MVVTVNPCTINDYTISAQPSDMIISFRNSQETKSQAYGVSQSPDCGYPETIEVINLPHFATHNANQKTFSVTNVDDQDDLGEYTITVLHKISVPTDT